MNSENAATEPTVSTDVDGVAEPLPLDPLLTVTSRRFVAHALSLLVFLLALVPLIGNGFLAVPDEGVYTAQADNIARGDWAQSRPTADLDRNGDWFVVTGSVIVGDAAIPYARRPLYPAVLSPYFGWFGAGGGLMLSAIGTWVAACASAGIAAELNRRTTLATLWLVGLGTPLVFDAFLIVGHSWCAASAAICAFALARTQRSQISTSMTLVWSAVAAGSAALCTLTRSEGVIAVLALSASMFLITAIERSQPCRRRVGLAASAVLVAAVGVAAYIANDLWSKAITDMAGVDATVSDRMPDLLGVAWSGLLQPWYPNNTAANAPMALVLLTSIAAPLIIRLAPRIRLLGFGMLALAAAASLHRALSEPSLVSGFLATTPWMTIGVLSLRRRNLTKPLAPTLALACAIATLAILATSYGFGGGAEWGGRFFHVLIPWLAPLGVMGLLELRRSVSRNEWFIVAAATATITASLSTMALRSNAMMRSDTERLAAFIQDARTGRLAGPVVLSTTGGDGTPRMLWQLSTVDQPLLTSEGIVNLPLFLDTMPGDIDRVQVLTDIPTTELLERVISNTRGSTWMVISSTDNGTAMTAYAVERQPT